MLEKIKDAELFLLGIMALCLAALLILAAIAIVMSIRWDVMGQGFKDLLKGNQDPDSSNENSRLLQHGDKS